MSYHLGPTTLAPLHLSPRAHLDPGQYGFAYFYYLQNVANARDVDWDALWSFELDTDGSGFLDANELLTLTSMAKGKEPTDADVEDMQVLSP